MNGSPGRTRAPSKSFARALSLPQTQEESRSGFEEVRRWKRDAVMGRIPSDPVALRLQSLRAPSTWKGYRTVANWATRWLNCDLDTLLYEAPDEASYVFLAGMERQLAASSLSLGTVRKYVSSFRRLLQGSATVPPEDLEILLDYSKALVRDGANMPALWAIPLPRRIVRQALKDPTLPLEVRAALYLAWKTASRWDDVVGLSLPLQYQRDRSQLLVRFLDNTKTSVSDPFAGRFIALVDWSRLEGTPPSPEILKLLTTSTRRLCPDWDTHRMNVYLAQIEVPAEAMEPPPPEGIQYRTHFTCHSIKRGADRHLWVHGFLEKYDQPEERLDPEIIERICKHLNPRGEKLGSTTLRYAPDPYIAALALETHLASRLL